MFTKLFAYLSGLASWVSAFLQSPTFREARKYVPLIQGIVADLENTKLSGREKFAKALQAFQNILGSDKFSNLDTRVINLAIEIAVSLIKK